VPLERVLGPELGAVYAGVHRDRGVELVTGSGLERFEGHRSLERVRLSGGRTIDCDLAVVGVGVSPRTALAEAAGIAVGDGVLVSERPETSVPGIFAAGDLANARHPFYGSARPRPTSGFRTSSRTSTTSAWSTRATP
jgi:3-phenylpropionate/trans-cinnamate dioxygenase ferredoxin reductase component